MVSEGEPLDAGGMERRPVPRPRFWDALTRSPGLALALATGGVVALLAGLYLGSQTTVWVEVNGVRLAHTTHENAAEAILRQLGIRLGPEDLAELPTTEGLRAGEPIRLAIARPVALVRGESVVWGHTQGETVIEAVADLGVKLRPEDRVFMDGVPAGPYDPLPPVAPGGRLTARRVVEAWRRPLTLRVRHAALLTVYDGDSADTFGTTAMTVGEALRERGYTLYAGDRIAPSLGARVASGQAVYLKRATPVVLSVGGEPRAVRTHSKTVAELLSAERVTLDESDYVQPAAEEPVTEGLVVQVVRVTDQHYIQETPVAYRVVEVPDPEMEIDTREVTRWGHEGAKRQSIRVHYENGREVFRTYDDEWLERDPLDRIISYGTRIVLRELSTPHGTFTYWRKLRMLATSYNGPTAGTPPDAPNYGLTRLGWRAAKGVIAVDPRVIPLTQPMYVPDYGPGVAADTGSAIKWRRVDLCYDDHNLVLWHKWVDVYLLTPVPPRSEILWQVPNEPAERG